MSDAMSDASATTKKSRRRRRAMSGVPYASATSTRSQDETKKLLLEKLGCEEAGFYDKPGTHEVLLQFKHRGRQVQLRVSATGWAQFYLKQHPWNYSRRGTRQAYEDAALKQGYIALNSMLRDWIKGQITAIECGILSFEAAFMPHMLTNDGRPLIERLKETDLLPKPEQPKIVALPARDASGSSK
jgi:hypothetical protein